MRVDRPIRHTAAIAVTGAAALLGCGSGTTGPQPENVHIEVRVTGGLVGVDYTYEIVGSSLQLRGVACERACDFEPGDVLAYLTPAQVVYYAQLLEDAGVLGLDGTDFGEECCDQFHYALDYRSGQRAATVRGSAGALPDDLARAIAETHRLYSGLLPILIEWDSEPDDWPQDALTLSDYELDGGVLSLDVAYGGGCVAHDLDLVAWGGWLESFPVQVNVLLTHDDRDDMCDAIISRTLRFDLTRLREEYQRSYPTLGPAPSTLVIRLTVPDGEAARQIAYTF